MRVLTTQMVHMLLIKFNMLIRCIHVAIFNNCRLIPRMWMRLEQKMNPFNINFTYQRYYNLVS